MVIPFGKIIEEEFKKFKQDYPKQDYIEVSVRFYGIDAEVLNVLKSELHLSLPTLINVFTHRMLKQEYGELYDKAIKSNKPSTENTK